MLGYPMGQGPLGYVPRFLAGYVPIVTERFATLGWTQAPDDVTPGQHIAARLSPMTITRSLPVSPDGIMGGIAQLSAGTIEIANNDGALDYLADIRGVEGRQIRLKVASARAGWPRVASMASTWVGYIESWVFRSDRIEIYTRDALAALDRPISTSTYSGEGRRNGDASLAGQYKPVGFGPVRNATPVLVDSEFLIYQFHDGLARELLAVRDMGSPLPIVDERNTYEELLQAEIQLGEVISCRREGFFRLGDFANGDITCDFLGDGEDPAIAVSTWDDGLLWDDDLPWDEGQDAKYTDTAAGIILRLLTSRGGISPSLIDLGQFRDAIEAWPYPVQVWAPSGTERVSVKDVIGQIAEAAGLIISPNRGGLVFAKRLSAPVGGSIITEEDILSIDRLDAPFGRPIWQIGVPYDANQTIQSDDDLVEPDDEGISKEALQTYKNAYGGIAYAGSTQVLRRVQNARTVSYQTAVYATQAGADARARDIAISHGPGRAVFQVVCKRRGWRLDLGDPVTLSHSRYGLSEGRPMIVVGVQDNGPARQVQLDLLG